MPRKAHAQRYARAIFEIALEKKELDRWQADLAKAASAFADPTFLAAMESPKIRLADKSRLLGKQIKVSPLVVNLLLLLISRNAAHMVGEIAAEYRRMVEAYHGIQEAEVTTAVPLGEDEKSKLTAKLSDLVGSKVVIRAQVDPAVLGGVVARVGGKLLDGSTRSRLEALKKELSGR